MDMKESFPSELNLPQPKNTFKLTLIDDVTKEVVQEVEYHNVVSPWSENLGKGIAGLFPSGSYAGADTSRYIGTNQGQMLCLLNDAYGVTAGNKLCNFGKSYPARTGEEAPGHADTGSPRVVGYCLNNATSNADTKGGVFVSSLSGWQRFRSKKWTYEWGTTQSNGTIKSLGFFQQSYAPNNSYKNLAKVPELDAINWAYTGYKTVGLDKHIYFSKYDTTSNNVVVLNAADFSHVATKTMTSWDTLWNGNSAYQPGMINGYYYAIQSVSGGTPSLVMKKATESASMTFGAPFTVTYSFPAGWTSFNFYKFTADERYIYGLCYNQVSRPGIWKFDTLTDTYVGTTELPTWVGSIGGWGESTIFNICPNTQKLLTNYYGAYIMEIANPDVPAEYMIRGFFSPGLYLSNSYAYPQFYMELANGNLCLFHSVFNAAYYAYYNYFYELLTTNYYTYAELPAPITKTNTQSLRLEYTLSW